MPIINREYDISEKRQVICEIVNNKAAGTYGLFLVPYAMSLDGVRSAAVGVSGAVVAQVAVQRFIAGTGFTSILVGSTITVTAVGTSGAQGISQSGGASLFNLQQDDLVSLVTTGTGVTEHTIGLVLKALQDIKSPQGLTS
jgi:hypothetical protein